MTRSRTLKIAAVQLQTRMGDVAANIYEAERLVEQAFSEGAELVALPEFFTGMIAPDDAAFDIVLPADNAAIAMLKRQAAKHGGRVGGSMLVADNGEIYNRYVFAEPDGTTQSHDKDLPTMWENVFYTGGRDDGVWETGLGTLGAAVCWELIRHQTLARMRGRVELAVTGTHWWTMPENWPSAVRAPLRAIGQYNRYMSEQAPVEFARRLGAPVVQASHCGPMGGKFLLAPGLDAGFDYRTHFVGATQIVDGAGHVQASRNTAEGPGIVHAEVGLGAGEPVIPPEQGRFWVPERPLFLKAYWHQQNVVGRSAYRRYGRARGLEAAERNRAL